MNNVYESNVSESLFEQQTSEVAQEHDKKIYRQRPILEIKNTHSPIEL